MKETAERMPIWEVCLQTAVDIIAKTNYTEQLPMETMGFPGGLTGKESTCNVGDLGSILSWEDLLEKGMATHSSSLAWRIPRGCK